MSIIYHVSCDIRQIQQATVTKLFIIILRKREGMTRCQAYMFKHKNVVKIRNSAVKGLAFTPLHCII